MKYMFVALSIGSYCYAMQYEVITSYRESTLTREHITKLEGANLKYVVNELEKEILAATKKLIIQGKKADQEKLRAVLLGLELIGKSNSSMKNAALSFITMLTVYSKR